MGTKKRRTRKVREITLSALHLRLKGYKRTRVNMRHREPRLLRTLSSFQKPTNPLQVSTTTTRFLGRLETRSTSIPRPRLSLPLEPTPQPPDVQIWSFACSTNLR